MRPKRCGASVRSRTDCEPGAPYPWLLACPPWPCASTLFRKECHADTTSSSSGFALWPDRRPGLQRLGRRGPAVARRAARLYDRRGQFLTRWRERLGAGRDQPAADHRRPPLDGCRRAGRNPGRRRHGPHERRYRRVASQSRRPDHPAAIDAGHPEHPCASSRTRPGIRDRYAESRLYASATRRIPDRGRSRRQHDRHRRSPRPGRGLWRGRGVCGRFAAAVSLHGNRLARVPVYRRAAPDEFDRWASDRDRRYDNSPPPAMYRRT